jgi:hypothetical protein
VSLFYAATSKMRKIEKNIEKTKKFFLRHHFDDFEEIGPRQDFADSKSQLKTPKLLLGILGYGTVLFYKSR